MSFPRFAEEPKNFVATLDLVAVWWHNEVIQIRKGSPWTGLHEGD